MTQQKFNINLQGQEINLKLRIDNILFFREALVKRITQLKIQVEHTKIMKGQQLEKKLTDNEIKTLNIIDINKHIAILKEKIELKEINYYNVKTLINLCQKVNYFLIQAVENYSAVNDPRYTEYLNIVKNMLSREEIAKLLKSNDV